MCVASSDIFVRCFKYVVVFHIEVTPHVCAKLSLLCNDQTFQSCPSKPMQQRISFFIERTNAKLLSFCIYVFISIENELLLLSKTYAQLRNGLLQNLTKPYVKCTLSNLTDANIHHVLNYFTLIYSNI